MKRAVFLAFLFLLGASTVKAQSVDQKRLEAQKRLVGDLEKQIVQGRHELNTLKQGRSSAEDMLLRLTRQIDSRNQLLGLTGEQAAQLTAEIERADSTERVLSERLDQHKARYAEMVREAYRNYKHNNYLAYIFSSHDFRQAARRISDFRAVSDLRARQMQHITTLSGELALQRIALSDRQRELDSVKRSLAGQREQLQQDSGEARERLEKFTEEEKRALRAQETRRAQLEVASDELRRLSRGNLEGAAFSAKTSGLRIPVAGGRAKLYKENTAEFTGGKGAQITAIHDGKVVDVRRNRLTQKFEVYIAHGEYVSTYANLSAVTVSTGTVVARNQAIGVIGSWVDAKTLAAEYKLNFGIFPPKADQKLQARSLFQP